MWAPDLDFSLELQTSLSNFLADIFDLDVPSVHPPNLNLVSFLQVDLSSCVPYFSKWHHHVPVPASQVHMALKIWPLVTFSGLSPIPRHIHYASYRTL